jgi:hypothetical protein
MIVEAAKEYEKPDTGIFNGTIIDVIDLGKVQKAYGMKVMIRILWVLDKNDSEGNPYRVMREVNAVMHPESKLFKTAQGVFGTAPPIPFNSETLMGRSNKLVIVRTQPDAKGRVYANIVGIEPLPQGAVAPTAPLGFVRHKDRPQQPQSAAPAVAQAPQTQPAPQLAPQPASVPQGGEAPKVDAAF